MVTFVELRDTRLESLAEAAETWRTLARQTSDLAERVVRELTGPLRTSGWAGAAAKVAFDRLDLVEDEFELAALQSRMVAIVAAASAARLAGVQKRLHAVIDAAHLLALTVDDTGTVRPPPADQWQRHSDEGRIDRSRQAENARIYSDLIAQLVAEATDDDRQIGAALDRLQPDRVGAMDSYEWKDAIGDARQAAAVLGFAESNIPKEGTDPQRVGTWWQSLSDDERQLCLAAYPDLVGGLDGLPATARDEANRLALRAHLGELEMASSDSEQRRRDVERCRNLLAKLEAAEYGPPSQRLLLLGLDTANDGRAVVAVGNPDTARHTTVIVPGVGTELDDMRGQIDRAEAVQAAADDLTYGTTGDVAVVAWLGYDAPGADGSAIGHGHAEAGAPLLDGFINGLNAAHDDGPSHLSVIGHSYGSTVVGEAASTGDGLAVSDIITAGSPGMHVDTAEELQLDPRHVWAGHADGDPISGVLGSIPFIHDNEPSDADFGANRYRVDTSGHSDYWKRDTVSLRNQAAIVVGQYDVVSLDHGSAPR